MISSGVNVKSLKEVEARLKDVGDKLVNHRYSTTDELIAILRKAWYLLSALMQKPPLSIRNVIQPIQEALPRAEFLHHEDVKIQAGVTLCTLEITRIVAPKWPYDNSITEEIFRSMIIAIKHLSCESPGNAPLEILDIVANTRSSLLMFDLDSGLIIEMFQVFLNTIRSDHSPKIFKSMQMIMTTLIEASDEISLQLLNPLLASVRMDNKIGSPMSWELGKSVFEKCATKIQPHVREAVKQMSLDTDEYAEIVKSLCKDTSNGENMNREENEVPSHEKNDGNGVALGDQIVQLGSNTVTSDTEHAVETVQNQEANEAPSREMDDGNGVVLGDQIVPLESNTVTSDTEHAVETVQPNMDMETLKSKRERKPNLRYNNDSWSTGSSRKESVRETSRKGQSETKKNTLNEQRKLNIGGSKGPKIIDPSVVVGLSQTSLEKEEIIFSDSGLEGKDDMLIVKKRARGVVEKMAVSPSVCKPTKTNRRKNLAKEKNPKTPVVVYGEEVINSRIQVWWPDDKMFYTGTVTAFGPKTKMYKITYDDDDEIEFLNLSEEIWEPFNDRQPQDAQSSGKGKVAADVSPVKEPVKSQKNTVKRKAGSSTKQHDASSSKRPKSESGPSMKSGEISAPDVIHVTDEPEMDTRALMNNRENWVDVDEPKTVMNQTEHGAQTSQMHKKRINYSRSKDMEVPKRLLGKSATRSIEMVDVNGYKVKAIAAPILEAIFRKYGDIAANCIFDDSPMRSTLLEAVCNIVQKLQNYSFNLNAIKEEFSVAKVTKIDVSWLHDHFSNLEKVSNFHKEKLLLKKSKENFTLAIEEANQELLRKRAELEMVLKRVNEAENNFNVMKLVGKKIEDDIQVSENEVCLWRRSVDGLLDLGEDII